ncbi:hypothetical protein [Nonomuraea sp. NPDC023979]|uniref:hypothetical protein n=1 Tax=Nonomuraea sp. NPDC023979 TaxID=3154796 RepID=UPI0034115329
MTKFKFDSQMHMAAADALAPHIRGIYDRPGSSILFIGEAKHVERTQPAPDSDAEASVKVRIIQLEIPNRDQEDAIREAARALHLQRTAQGTLDEEGQLILSQGTLKRIAGRLHEVEVSRLRAGLGHWVAYAQRVKSNGKLTATELRQEMDQLADGLAALLANTGEEA